MYNALVAPIRQTPMSIRDPARRNRIANRSLGHATVDLFGLRAGYALARALDVGVQPMLRKTDFLWLLLLPLYQSLGTLRHEGSHALVALIQGARIQNFVFLPSISQDRGLLWGYVSWEGQTTWLATAAPYLVDLLTYLVFFAICYYARNLRRWLWLNLVIVGMISPLVNSLYNYLRGFSNPFSDIARLLAILPQPVVHLYFAVTLVTYAIGLLVVFRYSRMASQGG